MSDTETLYQELVLERGRAPRHGRLLECFDAEAHGDNPMCGDRLHLRLRRDEGGRIVDAGFCARGCAISVASADLMADAVIGLDGGEARMLAARFGDMIRTGAVPDEAGFGTLSALAGVHEYRSRMRCATLPWTALEAAVDARHELADSHAESGR